MTPTLKHTLLALLAVAAVLALAGTALASGPRSAFRAAGAQAGPGYGRMAGPGYGLMAGGVVLHAAADYIGISQTALTTSRHSGKSLAQIATANGKSVAGLQQALVTAVQLHLDKAVAAHTLTATRAAQMLETFKSRVATLVNRTATGPMSGRGGGLGLGLGQGMCGGRR